MISDLILIIIIFNDKKRNESVITKSGINITVSIEGEESFEMLAG